MNLTKARTTLTALRDEKEQTYDNVHGWHFTDDPARTPEQIAALTALIDLLDTSKWPEHAKALKIASEFHLVENESFEAGAVALTLVPQLEARVKVLAEALAFYADESNWQNNVVDIGVGNLEEPGSSEACQDDGRIARRALTGAKENEHG